MHWSDLPLHPSPRTLRQFAALWLVLFGALAGWESLYGRRMLAVGLVTLAVGVGAPGLLRPNAVRPIFRTWLILAFPFGWVSSRLLLACLFFGVLTPLSLWFRIVGRDALARRRHHEQASYWQTRPAVTDARRYYRQF